MKKRILSAILAMTAAALVCAYTTSLIYFYSGHKDSMVHVLQDEAHLIAVGLSGKSLSESASMIEEYTRDAVEARVTLIDAHGDVLYDSVYDAASMENHSERPEIEQAAKTGRGSAIRSSESAGEVIAYAAQRFDNGRVVRVSRSMASVRAGAVQGLPLLLAVVAVLVVCGYVIARRQARILVEPLENIDLDHPLEGDIYPEFASLLTRIDKVNKDKEAAAQSRREFSANVSHELKTPLTSISGYAELIRDGVARSEDVPEFAGRIHQEATNLLALVSDIIELSRLDEQGDMRNEDMFDDVDIAEISREVAFRYTALAHTYNVNVTFSGSSVYVRGQRRMLDELVSNLVDNAVKYNHPGGSVRVWAGPMRGVPTVIVTDTGIGINLDDQEHVFERFYRVDKSHSKETGGTGLGLSIVKHVAQVHGAAIAMESAPGKGTRISVAFVPTAAQSSSGGVA